MVPIKEINTMEKLLKTKYGNSRQPRMVGIMFARPNSNNKQFIQDNYQYWNDSSGNFFDIYWAGYGAYYNEDDSIKKKFETISVNELNYKLQFETKAYVETKRIISKYIPSLYTHDGEPILILTNYIKGKIDYENAIALKLTDDKANINNSTIVMQNVMNLGEQYTHLDRLQAKLIQISNKPNPIDKIERFFNIASFFK